MTYRTMAAVDFFFIIWCLYNYPSPFAIFGGGIAFYAFWQDAWAWVRVKNVVDNAGDK